MKILIELIYIILWITSCLSLSLQYQYQFPKHFFSIFSIYAFVYLGYGLFVNNNKIFYASAVVLIIQNLFYYIIKDLKILNLTFELPPTIILIGIIFSINYLNFWVITISEFFQFLKTRRKKFLLYSLTNLILLTVDFLFFPLFKIIINLWTEYFLNIKAGA